jgi:hypothetical protein
MFIICFIYVLFTLLYKYSRKDDIDLRFIYVRRNHLLETMRKSFFCIQFIIKLLCFINSLNLHIIFINEHKLRASFLADRLIEAEFYSKENMLNQYGRIVITPDWYTKKAPGT